ncbi:MAG: hypothetical protein PHW11_07670 [Anaerolineaceae bacterium]|nr:hypothetical protein [Anaerolineaceae bacterium]MDD4043409.1 hypothetical protein [Anaerolineaceae bacterium]MDD4578007.1 hypothetical protein [Anaerolineaceae bacterium]
MSDQDINQNSDADRWANVPREPFQSNQPTEPEPFVTEPAPETVFSSEPMPVEPEPVIYDPVRDEHEPYVEVTPEKDGFTAAPAGSKVYTQPPVEKKKSNGWVIALIVLLVLCLCVCIAIVLAILVPVMGYRIEWSYVPSLVLSFM